jgi:hypothetical protein
VGMESRHSWDILPDGALAIDSTELKLLSFHSTEFASPELCCSATTEATADREQACRAPGGEQDRQPPTPRGAGVAVPAWGRACKLPVRVPAVTPTSPAKICGRMRDRIRLDGAAGVLELCGQAEAGATGAGSCIAAMMVQRVVLSHASDEGRFAGGEVAGCEYSRVSLWIDELFLLA